MDEIQLLKRKLEREQKAREALEELIETKTREFYNQKKEVKQKVEKDINVKYRLLIPLICILSLLFSIAITEMYLAETSRIQRITRSAITEIDKVFRRELEHEIELLNGLMYFLEKDDNFQNAWFEKDRDELLFQTEPLFKELREKHRITHFYFIELDKTCFLRVHNPPRHDDLIDRYTLDYASNTSEPVAGIELGTFGTFTLRAVHPWIVDDRLVGYIELGMEIDHIISRIADNHEVDLILVIKKQFLDRASWEEGLNFIDKDWEWEKFSDFVVTGSSADNIPEEIGLFMTENDEMRNSMEFSYSASNKKYSGGFIPLIDAGNRNVGDVFISTDITKDADLLQIRLLAFLGISVILGGILIILSYKLIDRMEKELRETNEYLNIEIIKRQKTEKALETEKVYFEQLFENAPEAVVLTDTEGKIQKINTEFTRVFGYTLDESISRLLGELIGGKEQEEKAKFLTKRVVEGEIIADEAERYKKGSLKIHVSILGTRISIDGKVEAIYWIYRDITDRRKMEIDLRERTKEQNGLYSLGELIEKNKSQKETFSEFLTNIVPPSTQFPDKVFASIKLDGEEYYFGNNENCVVNLNSPIQINGEERGELEIGYTEDLPFIDIFEKRLVDGYAERLGRYLAHKESEKMLIESELKFRNLFESSNDAIMMLDEKGFFDCNKATMDMFGCSTKEEFCSMHPAELSPEKQPDGSNSLVLANKEIESAYKTGTNFFQWIHQRINGDEFPAEVLLNRIEIEGKTVLQAVVRDISERIKLESEKKNSERLKTVQSLIATFNHEMNQPLSVLSSTSSYLKKKSGKDNSFYKDFEMIHDETWKMVNLVKKMSNLKEFKTKEYSPGSDMLDIEPHGDSNDSN